MAPEIPGPFSWLAPTHRFISARLLGHANPVDGLLDSARRNGLRPPPGPQATPVLGFTCAKEVVHARKERRGCRRLRQRREC